MKKMLLLCFAAAFAFGVQQHKIEDDMAVQNTQIQSSPDLFPTPDPLVEQMMQARKNHDMTTYNRLFEEYKSHLPPTQENKVPDIIELKPEDDPIMRWGGDVIIYNGQVNYNSWAMLTDVDDEAISVDYFRGDTLRAVAACADSVVRVFLSDDQGQTWTYEHGFYFTTPSAVYEPEIIHGPDGPSYHVFVRNTQGNGDLFCVTYTGGSSNGVWIEHTDDTVRCYSVCSDRAEWPTQYYLYLAYHKGLGGVGNDGIWFTRSLDFSTSWETAYQLQFAGSGFPDLTFSSGAHLHETYLFRPLSGNKDINARVSTDYGVSWQGSVTVETDTLIKQGPQIAAAHEGSGDAWIVWPRRWSGEPYDYDLWWSWSQDFGATWSTPAFLSSYFAQEVLPSIVVYDSSDSYYPYVSYVYADTTWENPLTYSTNWTTDSTWADRQTYNDSVPEFVRPSQTWQAPGVPAFAYVGSGGTNVYYDSWANVGVEEVKVATSPRAFLSPNQPNPFVSVTGFAYSIPENSMVDIRVYNALGQQITTLVHAQKSAGTYNVTWNAVDEKGAALPKGIYFLKLTAGNLNATRKLILD